jgi:hypothetical protein
MPSHEVGGLLDTKGGLPKTFKMNFHLGSWEPKNIQMQFGESNCFQIKINFSLFKWSLKQFQNSGVTL